MVNLFTIFLRYFTKRDARPRAFAEVFFAVANDFPQYANGYNLVISFNEQAPRPVTPDGL